jgi:lipoate-protein ligase A
MPQWRLLELDHLSYPDFGAFRLAMLRRRAAGLLPDTLLLMRPSGPGFVYSYYLDPDTNIDLDYCRAHDIPFVRTLAPGGAGYADSSSLLAAFWLEQDHPLIGGPTADCYRSVVGGVARALGEHFGITARYRPLNDLEIQGAGGIWRKPGFFSFSTQDRITQYVFSLQVQPAQEGLLASVIKPPPEKFADKQTKDAGERSTSLSGEVRRELDFAEVRGFVVDHMAREYGIEFACAPLTADERRSFEDLRAQFNDPRWLYDRSPQHRWADVPPSWRRGRAVQKIAGGPLLDVSVQLEGETLRDLLITGSLSVFPFLPQSPVHCLETVLRNSLADEASIRAKTQAIVDAPGHQFISLSADDIATAVCKAVDQARRTLDAGRAAPPSTGATA